MLFELTVKLEEQESSVPAALMVQSVPLEHRVYRDQREPRGQEVEPAEFPVKVERQG